MTNDRLETWYVTGCYSRFATEKSLDFIRRLTQDVQPDATYWIREDETDKHPFYVIEVQTTKGQPLVDFAAIRETRAYLDGLLDGAFAARSIVNGFAELLPDVDEVLTHS